MDKKWVIIASAGLGAFLLGAFLALQLNLQGIAQQKAAQEASAAETVSSGMTQASSADSVPFAPTPEASSAGMSLPAASAGQDSGASAATGSYKHVVFIGGVRTEDIKDAAGEADGVYFECDDQAGKTWIDGNAMPAAQKWMDQKTAVYVMADVQDTKDPSGLSSCIASWAEVLKAGYDADVFFVNCGPSADAAENETIVRFNAQMKDGLGSTKEIDLYSYLKDQGYSCTGKERYDKATSLRIYRYLTALAVSGF